MANASRRTRRPKQQYACESCGVVKWQWPSQVSKHFYCSRKCCDLSKVGRHWNKGNAGRTITARKPCAGCGEDIVGIPSVVARRKFCCQGCSGKFYSGKAHPHWDGGVSAWRKPFGLSESYKSWRLEVVKRDGGRCRWCLSLQILTYRPLEVHHIIPVAAHPELALNVGNGITLCRSHHAGTKGRENESAEFFAGLISHPLGATPVAHTRRPPVQMPGKEALSDLYLRQRKSTIEIAAAIGCTSSWVQKHLRKHGILVRGLKEAAQNNARRQRHDVGS